MAFDPATWALVRRAYETGNEPLARIGRRYGVTVSAIQKRARKDDWARRKDRPKYAPDAAIADVGLVREPVTAGGMRAPDTAEERRDRFFRIIDRLLERMEHNVSSSMDLSPQDQERHARALAATLSTMERVSEAADTAIGAVNKAEGKPADGDAEADRMRREIAERLDRLSAQWLAQAKPE